MNYRDKIRKAIECPQFGYDHYGEWGALRLDQRKHIKRLLDELDSADAYILKLQEENRQLIEYLKEQINECKLSGNDEDYVRADVYEEILSKIEKSERARNEKSI